MSFRQLYYTSCEQGLSGYAGYQFNAITPGTGTEIRRQVESLTGYEAPHSLAYSTDADDLARCPVNLCYSPGPTTIVASVQYVGKDSSRRFGNYFAHALATSDDADFGEVLPIELWRAPFWVREQAQSAELPGLDGPLQRGPLGREQVGSFLAAHPHRGQLSALLSAVGAVTAGTDRPVLVVEEAVDDVARWFAAISYLLPPRFVRQLSFATYLNRPSRSRLQLLGTVAETNLDLGSDAPDNFSLFDFQAGRFAPVPEHPLARLTAGIELPTGPALWDWVGVVASGAERSLDDWYPVAAAAAALGRIQLSADDVAAATSWLESATYLPAQTQSEIGWVLHDHPATADREYRVLRDVGKRSGDQSLYEQVQCELLDAQMRAAMTANSAITASAAQAGPNQADPNRADPSQPGPEQAGPDQAGQNQAGLSQVEAGPAPIGEDSVRDRTVARCQELLQQCEAGPDALRLLDWAAAARLTLDPEILIGVTRRVIAPWLTQDSPADQVDDELRRRAHRVAGFWPEFRSGLVICLTGLSRDAPSTLLAVMSGLIGELVVLEDLRAHPALAELYLICLARRRRDRRVDIAVRIAERRGSQPIDATLLALIWPSAGWTRAEALEVRKRLSPRQLAGPGVLGWFYQAVEQELRPDDVKAHVLLCQQLLATSLAERLGDRQVAHLEAMIELDRLARNTTTLEDLIPFIAAAANSDSAPVRGLLRSRVIAALVRVDVGPDQLVRAVQLLPPDVFGVYLLKVQGLLAQLETPPAHLAGLWMLACSGLDPQRAEPVSQLLDYAVLHVHRRDLDDVARLLETLNPSMAAEFQTVASEARAGAAGRAVRSVAGRLATFARGRSQDSEAGSAQDCGQEPKG